MGVVVNLRCMALIMVPTGLFVTCAKARDVERNEGVIHASENPSSSGLWYQEHTSPQALHWMC